LPNFEPFSQPEGFFYFTYLPNSTSTFILGLKSITRFIYNNNRSLLVIWFLLIFVLCATPGNYIPSADWLELLSFDKWVHTGLFFVLTALFFLYGFKKGKVNTAFISYAIFGILYGIVLEIMQGRFFSNRAYDPMDMLANSIGCLLALVLKSLLFSRFRIWSQ
jgi:VanZ family protein